MRGEATEALRALAGPASVLAFVLAVSLLYLLPSAGPARAQSYDENAPTLISADEVTHDDNLGVVTASGNVEISQSGRVLLADTVTYNQRTEVVTASGDVTLMEPGGEVLFADFVELTEDMREGFIRDIRVLLTDRSRLAAVSGLRSGGRRTLFKKGVFSPCELCREDPTRAPLWQIKAVEVEHDQEERMIKYRDAWMEMFGVPIFYTPYFEHPDPTVERKSGFLAPSFGSSETLGATFQQPYYWAIATDKDLTVAPIFTSKQSIVAAGEYRHLFPSGRLDVRASATQADRVAKDGTLESDKFRGHIDGQVRYEFTDTWRGGADVQLAVDDTYLRVYNFSDDSTLTNRLFAEGFNGRNYAAINNYYFQGLRSTDRQPESPIILPMLDYNFVSEPGAGGGRYSFDGNLLVLTREQGRDSRRLSTAAAWELPFTSPIGDIYTFTARAQGDVYWVNGVVEGSDEVNSSGPTESDVTGRFFPQLAVNWRYPWVRSSASVHQVVEPIAQVVLAPNGSNPTLIPNEDSLDFEFDETNLFSLNRFPGTDRIDPGSRVDYGVRWSASGDEGGYVSAFLGQSYRLSEPDVFPEGSGVEDDLSDIVGQVQIAPTHELDIIYRTRIDRDDFVARRNELSVLAGPPILNLNLNYTFVDSQADQTEFPDREQVDWTLSSKISRYWSLYGGQLIDIEENDTRQIAVGALYADECFTISAKFQRDFFSDREIEPEDSFFITVNFKHLGGFTSGALGTGDSQ